MPCFVAGLVNDPKYLSQDCDRQKETNLRSANVIFKSRKKTGRTVEDFAATNCVYSVAARTTGDDEELYVNYGSNLCFEQ